MNDDVALRDALDTLVPTIDETDEWADVLERAAALRETPRPPKRVRSLFPHRGRGLLLFAAAAFATALVLLAATAPWRGGPSVLERAAAAIASPVSGKVLYESVTIRAVPTLPPGPIPKSRVPGGLDPPYTLLAHINVWMVDSPPYRFRLREDASLSGRLRGNPKAVPLPPTEIGSTLGGAQGLAYNTPTGTLVPVLFPSRPKRSQLDITEFIWKALTSGRAKVVGNAVLDGRSVVRIRILVPRFGRVVSNVVYFVDATTYRPVRVAIDIDEHALTANDEPFINQSFPGFPLLTVTSLQTSSLPDVLGHYVLDFDAYRYLTPTPANERLTSIRAAHPRAKIV